MTVKVLALCGGVGGANLALGLATILAPDELAIVINTGDDFEHLSLSISPDVDTVTYTLAGLANPDLGWGLSGESWSFMAALRRLGGEDWFQLGDRDLATHVERTRRLRAGESLSAITADFARRLGVKPALLPMTDDPVRTMLETDEGIVAFQQYFVARRAQPSVRALTYPGAASATAHPQALAVLASPSLELVVICPSNPWLSVAPLLAMPALRDALATCTRPVIAVSPIVDGQAIKGPTAKLMAELGLPVNAATVARFYGGLIDGFLLDEVDAHLADTIEQGDTTIATAPTLMHNLDDKIALAREVLSFGARLRSYRSG